MGMNGIVNNTHMKKSNIGDEANGTRYCAPQIKSVQLLRTSNQECTEMYGRVAPG